MGFPAKSMPEFGILTTMFTMIYTKGTKIILVYFVLLCGLCG